MKKASIIFLIVILFAPQALYAQMAESEAYWQLLLRLVAALEAQVEALTAELERQEQAGNSVKAPARAVSHADEEQSTRVLGEFSSARSETVWIQDLHESEYHSGPYAALYYTDGGAIIPVRGSGIYPDDERVWDMFVDVVGVSFAREYLSEFRIYSDRDAEYDAFIDHIGRGDTWVLGVNVYDLDLTDENTREYLRELLIHEYGHILFFDNQNAADNFRDTFWSKRDIEHADAVASAQSADRRADLSVDYYERHRDAFVSGYATRSPLEDVIESFVHFATEKRPSGDRERDRKIKFFYDYPQFTAIRDRLMGR